MFLSRFFGRHVRKQKRIQKASPVQQQQIVTDIQIVDQKPGPTQRNRQYHLVVFGATGYTGKLVCEHIAKRYNNDVHWAIAGRDKQSLEQLKKDLVKLNPNCEKVPYIVANIKDQKSLDRMVKQTEVVLSTVGPYFQLGTPLVDAAVRLGTNVCDISGEPIWIKQMINKYHQRAEQKEVKIVCGCGFKCLPFDLGTMFVSNYMQQQLGLKCKKVMSLIGEVKFTISGGSALTSLLQFTLPSEEVSKLQEDPYFLDPADSARGHDKDFQGWSFHNKLQHWVTPSPYQRITTRMVRRTNALLNQHYGLNFKYQEFQTVDGPLEAFTIALQDKLLNLALSRKIIRNLILRFSPRPGTGPDRQILESGRWNIKFVGLTEKQQDLQQQKVVAEVKDKQQEQQPLKVIAEVKGNTDAFYADTSKMLAEAGMCLALQYEQLNKSHLKRSGVLTPASSMGSFLIDRLKKVGVQFNILEPKTRLRLVEEVVGYNYTSQVPVQQRQFRS